MARTPTVPDRPPCRLYLITPPAIPDLDAFAATLDEALGAGDVAALQIRLKPADDALLLDTSDLTIGQAVQRAIELVNSRTEGGTAARP